MVCSVPLREKKEIIAVLTLEFTSTPFTEGPRRLMDVVAGQTGPILGLAIQNDRGIFKRSGDGINEAARWAFGKKRPWLWAAMAAGAAVKGSSTAKTVAGLAAVGGIVLYWSLLGFLAFVGGCAGYWMSRSLARSSRHCENGIRFWRTLALGFAGWFIIRQLLFSPHFMVPVSGWPPGRFLYRLFFDSFNVVIVAALAIWMRRWWREFSIQKTDAQEPPREMKRRFVLWQSLGMIGPACLLAPILGGMLWHTFGPEEKQHLTNAEAQKIMIGRKDAWISVMEEGGTKTLWLHLPENDPGTKLWATANMPAWWNRWTVGSKPAWWNLWTADKGGNTGTWLTDLIYFSGYRPVELWTAANESTLKLLDDEKIHYSTGSVRQPGSREAWPFRSLWPFFIAPMGAVIILRQIRKGQGTTNAPGISETPQQESQHGRMLLALRTDAKARRVFGIAFAAIFLLAFSANAFSATKAFTAMGLYVVLFLGSVKGAFFGLVAGVGVLYLRTQRKVLKANGRL